MPSSSSDSDSDKEEPKQSTTSKTKSTPIKSSCYIDIINQVIISLTFVGKSKESSSSSSSSDSDSDKDKPKQSIASKMKSIAIESSCCIDIISYHISYLCR